MGVSLAWRERLLSLLVWGSASLISLASCWLLWDVLWQGLGLLSWDFLTSAPRDAGRAGGLGPILVSTASLLTICIATSLPVGVGTAVLLSELLPSTGRVGRLLRQSLDLLAGVPSVVFGLFGNALFCQLLGMGYSLLAGALTLSCMVLPLLVRTTEEGLRAVPQDLRYAGAALGLSRSTLIGRVLLPAAAPSIGAGLVLGVGRALAETAALLFTSGYVDRMPRSVWDSGRSLSIHIYDLSMNVAGGTPRAYGAALVLVGALALINALVAHWSASRTRALEGL